MKKIIIASAIAGIFAGQAAYAADAAPASDHAVSFNVGVTNDYRFRGISQTRMKPAISAGADYTHNPTGLYVGTWGSNVEWLKDNTGDLSDASLELDLYGGKRGEIGGFSYDVGAIRYYYPSNKFHLARYPSANTTEVYGQVGYGPVYIKYSQAVTKFLGWARSPGANTDTTGSNYIDIGANQEIKDGYILNLHYGKQVVKNLSEADYSDWKVGVTKDFGLAVVAVSVVGTNALNSSGAGGYNFSDRGYLGGTAGVVTVTKTF
jgi:uncharacterized protein (TIGR02001 family)